MNIVTTAGPTGPEVFNSTLQNLKSTTAQVGKLQAPITSIQSLVQDVDTLLADIVDILNFAEEVDSIIEVVAEALNFLDAVPIVGEIAGIMAEVIETIADAFQEALETMQELKSSIISPVQDVLKDMKIGLTDIRKVVVDISQKVPGYVNTVEILLYLSQIASPIAKILEDTNTPGGAATRLDAVLTAFNKVGTDVGDAIGALSPVLTVIEDAVKVLVDLFDAITGQNAGSQAQNQKSDSTNAHGNAQNTGDGFSRMQNAIKPVAWILDAILCIFKEILEPIINAILEATGLKAAVDAAAEAIFCKLGVSPQNPVLTNMSKQTTGSTNASGISSNGAHVNGAQGAATQHLWAAAASALGDYRNGASAGKDAIFALISAITGTPVNPKSPIVAPDWPNEPKLTPTPGPQVTAGQILLMQERVPEIHASVRRMLAGRVAAPADLPMTKSFLTTPQFKALDLPQINATQFPNCSSLVATIGSLITDLETLAVDGVSFQAAMVDLSTSLELPATYDTQVKTLATDLSEAETILEFLLSLNIGFVSDLVNPIEAIAKSQSADAAILVTQVPKLGTAVTALEEASAHVVSALPSMPLLEKTIREFDGWALGVHQLTQLVRHARVIDKNQGGGNSAQIDALVVDIETSADALNKRIAAIDTETKSLAGAISAMQQGLTVYATQLKSVSDHSNLLSDHALPYAQQAAHALGVVDSIIQPLSGLLVDLNCTDGTNLMKLGGKIAVDTMTKAAQAAATPPSGTFETLAENLAQKMLPLDQMAAAVQTAASDITQTTVAAFTNNSQALVTGLTNLDQQLANSKSYSTKTPTRDGKYTTVEKVNGVYKVVTVEASTVTQTVGNDLIDSELLTKVQTLIKALKLQRPAQAT